MQMKHKASYYGILSFPVFENSGKISNGYIFQTVTGFSCSNFRSVIDKVIKTVGGAARERNYSSSTVGARDLQPGDANSVFHPAHQML